MPGCTSPWLLGIVNTSSRLSSIMYGSEINLCPTYLSALTLSSRSWSLVRSTLCPGPTCWTMPSPSAASISPSAILAGRRSTNHYIQWQANFKWFPDDYTIKSPPLVARKQGTESGGRGRSRQITHPLFPRHLSGQRLWSSLHMYGVCGAGRTPGWGCRIGAWSLFTVAGRTQHALWSAPSCCVVAVVVVVRE